MLVFSVVFDRLVFNWLVIFRDCFILGILCFISDVLRFIFDVLRFILCGNCLVLDILSLVFNSNCLIFSSILRSILLDFLIFCSRLRGINFLGFIFDNDDFFLFPYLILHCDLVSIIDINTKLYSLVLLIENSVEIAHELISEDDGRLIFNVFGILMDCKEAIVLERISELLFHID